MASIRQRKDNGLLFIDFGNFRINRDVMLSNHTTLVGDDIDTFLLSSFCDLCRCFDDRLTA